MGAKPGHQGAHKGRKTVSRKEYLSILCHRRVTAAARKANQKRIGRDLLFRTGRLYQQGNNVVNVALDGACGHCTLQARTLNSLVTKAIRARFPQIRAIGL